jgi:hypothetical protein
MAVTYGKLSLVPRMSSAQLISLFEDIESRKRLVEILRTATVVVPDRNTLVYEELVGDVTFHVPDGRFEFSLYSARDAKESYIDVYADGEKQGRITFRVPPAELESFLAPSRH